MSPHTVNKLTRAHPVRPPTVCGRALGTLKGPSDADVCDPDIEPLARLLQPGLEIVGEATFIQIPLHPQTSVQNLRLAPIQPAK